LPCCFFPVITDFSKRKFRTCMISYYCTGFSRQNGNIPSAVEMSEIRSTNSSTRKWFESAEYAAFCAQDDSSPGLKNRKPVHFRTHRFIFQEPWRSDHGENSVLCDVFVESRLTMSEM
jgi:hypothetical protein